MYLWGKRRKMGTYGRKERKEQGDDQVHSKIVDPRSKRIKHRRWKTQYHMRQKSTSPTL